jgi:hypothetical protein
MLHALDGGGGCLAGGEREEGLFYMCHIFNVIILPQHTHTKNRKSRLCAQFVCTAN